MEELFEAGKGNVNLDGHFNVIRAGNKIVAVVLGNPAPRGIKLCKETRDKMAEGLANVICESLNDHVRETGKIVGMVGAIIETVMGLGKDDVAEEDKLEVDVNKLRDLKPEDFIL